MTYHDLPWPIQLIFLGIYGFPWRRRQVSSGGLGVPVCARGWVDWEIGHITGSNGWFTPITHHHHNLRFSRGSRWKYGFVQSDRCFFSVSSTYTLFWSILVGTTTSFQCYSSPHVGWQSQQSFFFHTNQFCIEKCFLVLGQWFPNLHDWCSKRTLSQEPVGLRRGALAVFDQVRKHA